MRAFLITVLLLICPVLTFAETTTLTELEKAKIAYSDASINLEIAQGKYNEAKAKLIQELQKPPKTVDNKKDKK